jgi:hypothetical protein
MFTADFTNGLPEAFSNTQKKKAPLGKGALEKFTHRWLHPNQPLSR